MAEKAAKIFKGLLFFCILYMSVLRVRFRYRAGAKFCHELYTKLP